MNPISLSFETLQVVWLKDLIPIFPAEDPRISVTTSGENRLLVIQQVTSEWQSIVKKVRLNIYHPYVNKGKKCRNPITNYLSLTPFPFPTFRRWKATKGITSVWRRIPSAPFIPTPPISTSESAEFRHTFPFLRSRFTRCVIVIIVKTTFATWVKRESGLARPWYNHHFLYHLCSTPLGDAWRGTGVEMRRRWFSYAFHQVASGCHWSDARWQLARRPRCTSP